MLLDKNTQELMECGFLDEELKISQDLRYYLEHLNLKANLEQVVKRAKEINAEAKKLAEKN